MTAREEVNAERNSQNRRVENGRMEGDRTDETRQGRTLSQQGVRKRAKRMML